MHYSIIDNSRKDAHSTSEWLALNLMMMITMRIQMIHVPPRRDDAGGADSAQPVGNHIKATRAAAAARMEAKASNNDHICYLG